MLIPKSIYWLGLLTLAPVAAAKPVTEFDPAGSKAHGWRVVNDGVMGGLSKGAFKLTTDGTLIFQGTLSLENNGGFSSIRTNSFSADLSTHKGVTLRVRGDGRRYQIRFSTDARFRGRQIDFKAEFEAPAGKWSEIHLPFSQFTGSFRGREIPSATFDPAKISRMGILIADKNPGPFELHVDWIRATDD